MRKVRLNGTLDRTRGFITPSESDYQCPYFRKRFFEHGPMKERRAVCEMKEGAGFCDYRLLQEDGTPICARYQHGPQYEIIRDTGQNIDATYAPIPYIQGKMEQEKDDQGKPLFWDHTTDPPTKVTTDTGDPVMVSTVREWLTNDFIDTHEKRFRIQDHILGWYHEV